MIDLRLRRFCRDTDGAAVILAALMMPVLVGGMGLGAEAGYRYFNQRLLQHAADVAAHSGAVRKYKGDTKPAIDAAALNVATQSEFAAALGTIVVNIPPTSGAFTGDPSAVEVILTETRPRLFSAIFSQEPVQIGARAVAAVLSAGQSGCILALSETEAGAVTVTGNTSVNLMGCSVQSNSASPTSFNMQGSGTLTTDCVSAVGGASTTAGLTLTVCESVAVNAPAVQDPYYWVMQPSPSGLTCESSKIVGKPNQSTTVTPSQTWTHPDGTVLPVMRFCNGMDLKGDVTFAPGLYIIEGGTMTSSGTSTPVVTGSGVTFYFTNGGRAQIGANTTLNLSAPTSGPYSGILFFADRTDPQNHKILGSSTSSLQGALYFSTSHLEFSGTSGGANGCTQVIADTITLTGNSSLSIDCTAAGTEDIVVGQLIALVE